jgi:hypothetical protein
MVQGSSERKLGYRFYKAKPWRWGSIFGAPGFEGIHLRHEIKNGRPVVTGLYVHGPEITSRLLRTLQLQQYAADMMEIKGDDLRSLALQPDGPKTAAAEDAKLTIAKLEARAKTAETYRGNVRFKPLSLSLVERLRTEDFDAFCGHIAVWYSTRAAQSRSPAKVMAEEIGVPVSRIYTWVREARVRGTLPPARKGVAG